jgi:hypothetical protein
LFFATRQKPNPINFAGSKNSTEELQEQEL